jgi:integrase
MLVGKPRAVIVVGILLIAAVGEPARRFRLKHTDMRGMPLRNPAQEIRYHPPPRPRLRCWPWTLHPCGKRDREGQALACTSVRRSEVSLSLVTGRSQTRSSRTGFRDQILVFLDGALGIRQGELGALRWVDCDFNNMNFSVQHSYYWRRGGHLKSTKTEASAKLLPMHPSLKQALLEWRSLSLYNQPGDFVTPQERHVQVYVGQICFLQPRPPNTQLNST